MFEHHAAAAPATTSLSSAILDALEHAFHVQGGQLIPRDRGLRNLCQRVAGMGSEATARLINLIAATIGRGIYAEVGSYRGRSLTAAAHGNSLTCLGIDNFCQFDNGQNEPALRQAIAPYPNIHFINGDYRQVFAAPPALLQEPGIGFYFYDGHHSAENQWMGLEAARPFLLDPGVILVDDVNLPHVLTSTLQWAVPNGFSPLLYLKSPSRAHQTWGNGVLVLISETVDHRHAARVQQTLEELTGQVDPRLRIDYRNGSLYLLEDAQKMTGRRVASV